MSANKKFSCIVVWTFHNDEKSKNLNLLLEALDGFESIDQSSMGGHEDPQTIYCKLLGIKFDWKDKDFIKIISSCDENEVKVQPVSIEANKELVRILYLCNNGDKKR